jgi:hypothetical protein
MLLREIGLELPQEIAESEIDYCNQVEFLSDPAISDSQLLDILQKIYRMDQHFPELRITFEGNFHSDFSFLIAALVLSYRKAVLGKFGVIKEIIHQGSTSRLENLLEHANWGFFSD